MYSCYQVPSKKDALKKKEWNIHISIDLYPSALIEKVVEKVGNTSLTWIWRLVRSWVSNIFQNCTTKNFYTCDSIFFLYLLEYST